MLYAVKNLNIYIYILYYLYIYEVVNIIHSIMPEFGDWSDDDLSDENSEGGNSDLLSDDDTCSVVSDNDDVSIKGRDFGRVWHLQPPPERVDGDLIDIFLQGDDTLQKVITTMVTVLFEWESYENSR